MQVDVGEFTMTTIKYQHSQLVTPTYNQDYYWLTVACMVDNGVWDNSKNWSTGAA